MAKGKVTAKSLRAGQTVYRVAGSGPTAMIEKLLITSRPFKYKKVDSVLNGTLWVNCRKFHRKQSHSYFIHMKFPDYRDDNFSLTDAGINGKHYQSYNRTFYTYKAATRWLEYVKTQPHPDSWMDDDLWSPMDDIDWDHSPAD